MANIIINRNSTQSMTWSASCTHKAKYVFPLGGGGDWVRGRVRPEVFYLIHINVPFVFQPSSHLVLNLFTSRFQCVPQDVPNSTTFNPRTFTQNWTLITYMAGPKGRTLVMLFWDSKLLFEAVSKVSDF
jgi:hypothetical protein